MLSTLLFILKIICIAVLAILGLVLFAVLLMLFVPVRYRLSCSYKEDFTARVKITWLLHILSVLATYDHSLELSIKLFGFPLGKGKRGGGEEEEPENGAEGDGEKDGGFGKQEREGKDGALERDGVLERDEALESAVPGERDGREAKEKEPSGGAKADGFSRESADGGKTFTEPPALKESPEKGKGKKKKSFSLNGIFRKIKFRFLGFCDKVRAVEEKGKKIHGFVTDPANQKSFRHILRMTKHILPRKMEGSLVFGFEDPSVTGQAAALCSLAYARYGDSLQITPLFDEQILEALVKGKGRIFLGIVLYWCLRVLMNKNIRRLLFKRRRKKDGGE